MCLMLVKHWPSVYPTFEDAYYCCSVIRLDGIGRDANKVMGF